VTSTRHLAIVGPTATGKSALALAVARARGDIEIVSLDSMQVYRHLDIGTAKPTAAEQAAVPHHLIDMVDADGQWSAVEHQRAARAAVAEIEARGKRAVLVGGTGLYVQAVVDDLRFPGEDVDLRAELDAWTAEPGGVAAAYSELERSDPEAASRIDPHNARRIVRALEVIRLTGRPFSSFGPGIDHFGPTAFPVLIVGVWLPRDVLAARIAHRFESMQARGLVDEVRWLLDRGGWSRTAAQAIGYKEVAEHLEGGGPSLEDALATAVRRTRSLSRRQRMWFRRDPRITWLGSPENPCRLLAAILATWS
jgi:tRNA dimethylallyltransferase